MSPPSPKSNKWVSPHLLLPIFLTFFTPFTTSSLSYTASSLRVSSSSRVSYTDHCNSIVPKSTPKYTSQYPSTFPQLKTGYFHGGDKIISQNDSSNSNSLRFRTHNLYKTKVDDIVMVDGVLVLRAGNMNYQPISNFSVEDYKRLRTRRPRFHRRMDRISFRLSGFWSESSGKLCMVGTGTAYSKEGNLLDLSVVFTLAYPGNSTIFTSLVSGKLESVDAVDSLNYFEPISALVYSQRNYKYTLNSNVDVGGFRKETALSLEKGQDVCSQLYDRSAYNLEYASDCNASKSCSPLDSSIGVGGLPEYIFFDDIQCSDEGRLRLLVGFSNASYNMYNQALLLGRMLVGEGVWSEEYNRLDVVACRVLNFTDSLVKASIGDCSVRLSMWFPAFLSIKNRSRLVGQLWSNKTVGEPGYFDKIEIQGFTSGGSVLPGLKYEYTEIGSILESCPNKNAAKGKDYPSVYSGDMRFDISVGNKKGQHAWGYSVPLSVGGEFYDNVVQSTYATMIPIDFVSVYDTLTPIASVPVHENQSGIVNVSYSISITPDYQVIDAGSSSNLTLNLNAPVEISAEGIYDTETGSLCMVGCRYVKSSNYHSNDCEIHIVVQFRPVGAESSEYVKGTIQSTRASSDPLYFEELQLSAISLSTGQVSESIWRMDLEITMVLVSNTLICIFVGLQIFYVKKHPDALPSISLFMLAILTLGQMIPLVLNFEALFLKSHGEQNVMMGSGGWLEVNEVLVRAVTMVSFLLQCHLLQLTWSSRSADGNKKSLAIAEKKALYVLIPLYLVGAFLAWGMHWWNDSPHESALHRRNFGFYQGYSLWGDLRSYAGLLLDGFLLPQILLNMFWNSKDKSLHPAFYVGITSVRLLPHAYDLYRAHSYANYYDALYIYANPRGDLFSTAWDVIIPFGGLLFAILIYLQQRFGGCCIIPPRFRQSVAYEKVPVANGE